MYTLELIRRVAIAAYSALALLVRPFSVFAWVDNQTLRTLREPENSLKVGRVLRTLPFGFNH
jgi:hypothetical protein